MFFITRVQCNYLTNPLGIDSKVPVFGWRVSSDRRNTFQKAYQIIVSQDEHVVWDSGRVESRRTYAIPYEGIPLVSRTEYRYQIWVWDNDENHAESEENTFETAFFNEDDWMASFVEPEPLAVLEQNPYTTAEQIWNEFVRKMMKGEQTEYVDMDALMANLPLQPYHPAVMMRKEFTIFKNIKKARIYMTAHGVYDIQVNGREITDALLCPEFTSYDKLLKYQICDVTNHLFIGRNALGVTIADGWYKSKLAIGRGNDYGDAPGLLLQLEISYEDNTCETIRSDETFRYSHDGPYRFADLFTGVKYDARLEMNDYSVAGFDDSAWATVRVREDDKHRLFAQTNPPIRAVEVLNAQSILTTPNGDTVVDFGQNIAGTIRAQITGYEGMEIVFEHSETLDEYGNFFYPFLGDHRKQTDIYICHGKGEENFTPKFTYHGFRYVRVKGYSGELKTDHFQAVAISSDNEIVGDFRCSDERLNRLQSNILWSQRSNMIGIPTDCPTREKAGWTGDVLIYAKTALFNQNLIGFFEPWIRNLKADQLQDGQILNIAPKLRSYIHMHLSSSIGWGDVILTLPWELYQTYGNIRVLSEHFDAMEKWIRHLEKVAAELPPEAADMKARQLENQRYIINTGFHLGDWLVPSILNESGFADGPMSSYLTKDFICTKLYANTVDIFSRICRELGYMDKAEAYTRLNERIRQAYEEEFVAEDGSLNNNLQGNYVLALHMNMVSDEKRPLLVKKLVELIRLNGTRLDTGFMSVPHILEVLYENGHRNLAYELLYQNQYPSWLYEIENGATTMWESWDAIRHDGKVAGCSFNHYAFGCVGDFIYRRVLGIQQKGIAYENVVINPDFSCRLTFASGFYESVHGLIGVEWKQDDETLELKLQIPPNISATLLLNDNEPIYLGNGLHVIKKAKIDLGT
ncbi:glycoside hydrolase family 78 protein [Paenibacillus macerans]|nr:alpha-L-rhamnosidase [Paenibacillus macerans]UMV45983.1 glycoside hydrolase family 78 protein [Paenibacillus macerans]